VLDYSNPQHVGDALRQRGIEPFVAGDAHHDQAEVQRWARIGGAQVGDLITSTFVNRGRLIELIVGEIHSTSR
jgi:hypothetical protein